MTAANKATTMDFGGRKIRFLPLNWEQLEVIQQDLDAITGMKSGEGRTSFFTPEERNSILNVITVAIKDSNPDVLDDAWIKRSINLANVNIVLANIFNANGFTDETASEGGQATAGSGEPSAVESGT